MRPVRNLPNSQSLGSSYGGKRNVQQVCTVYSVRDGAWHCDGALIFNYLPDIRADIAADVRAFRKLGTNHDLIPLYNKWFVSRLPTGEKLNVAISPQPEDAFKVLDHSEGGRELERDSARWREAVFKEDHAQTRWSASWRVG